MKILSKLDNTGMIEEVADKRYVTDAEKLTWNSKADKTYVDSKVKTDVPSGAKFTDTITSINGKTGTIAKADIVALGIPAQDTVYSHPSTHPASMITESSTKRFVSDSEKSTWNSKSDTDTVTTINGKTGAISKADIVALGIPASDTNTTYTEITTAEIDAGTASTLRTITARRLKYLLDKIVALFPSKTSELTNDSGFLTSVSKADVGLSNVDNTSDLNKPISTATQTALDSKVDDSRVLTDVPLNAEFTDTITTINSKTGIITKADIVALGIPSQDTNTITTINGKTGAILKADITALGIPAQDTVYSHPSTHPANMITESSTKRFVSDSEKSTWNGKQNALGYTPVNKAGDNITGQLGVESPTFPVIDIARNTSSGGTGLYGGARLQRKTTNPTNGVGIGFYFQAPNSNKAMTHAGMFGGALGTINAGSEKGEIVLSPSYAGQDPYARRDFIVRAISASKAEAELNGKLRTEQTLASDPINTVATKKYVDDNKTAEYTHPSSHPASMITESSTKRFVSDSERGQWNDKTKTITSATEPNLNTGDQWHKEI